MIDAFTRILVRYRWWYLMAGLILLVVGATYGTGVFSSLKSGGFTDPQAESGREAAKVATDFAAANPSIVVWLKDDGRTVDDSTYRQAVASVTRDISAQQHVTAVTDYYGSGQSALVSRDRHITYALVTLSGSENQQTMTYRELRDKLGSSRDGLTIKLGGPLAANSEVSAQIERDLTAAELISFPLLALLLIIIFRSVIAAALPLIIGALSILGAFIILRWIASLTDISVFASNVITLLGLGLAIDYSLFFVGRFRDELAAGGSTESALARTFHTAGRTIFFSGAIVALSLMSLLVFPQILLRSMGFGGAATVGFAVLTSLTILPAFLAVLGPRINRWALPIGPKKVNDESWGRFAKWVLRRYPAVLVGALALLVAAGLPFLKIHYADEGLKSLPSHFQSRQVGESLEHDFATSQTSSLESLVTFKADPTSQAALTELAAYTKRLAALPNVAAVDSAVSVQPGLTPDQATAFYSQSTSPAAAAAKAHYFHDHETLVTVKYRDDLPADDARHLLRSMRTVAPPSGADILVGGEQAALTDLLDGLQDRLLPAGLLIGGATFILLMLMLESVVVPLMAILLSVISLSASFGALTWIFQDGNGEKLFGFTSSGSINSTIPILIFVIAFGLAMDYEAFLISRMKEHYNKHRDNTGAIIFGVQKTGRIITSAAMLLIVVMLAFATSEIINMKEIGLGLAIAVGVDVLVVRSLLVPAAMRLLGNANWWAPRSVRRVAARLGLGEV